MANLMENKTRKVFQYFLLIPTKVKIQQLDFKEKSQVITVWLFQPTFRLHVLFLCFGSLDLYHLLHNSLSRIDLPIYPLQIFLIIHSINPLGSTSKRRHFSEGTQGKKTSEEHWRAVNGQERLQPEKSKSDSSRNFTFMLKMLKRRVEESESDTKSQKESTKQNFLRSKIQKKVS